MNQQAGEEPGAASPQYSLDGRWWWDGQVWRPATAPAQRPPASSPRIRPGRWLIVAAVLTVTVAAAMLVIVARNLSGGIIPAVANATRVTAPGTTQITLPSAGPYMINAELPDVGQLTTGDLPTTPAEVASLQIELVSATSGARVPVRDPEQRYAYQYGGRVGTGLAAFTVDGPGVYILTAHYPDGQSGPEIVLAVARGRPGDVLPQVLGNILAGLAGVVLLLVGLGGGGVALFLRIRAVDRARAATRAGT